MSSTESAEGLSVELRPVPHYWSENAMLRTLSDAEVPLLAGFKRKRTAVAVLSFASAEQRDAALEKVRKLEIKGLQGSKLRVREVPFKPPRATSRSSRDANAESGKEQRVPHGDEAKEQQERDVRDAVAPWWRMPYADQKVRKAQDASRQLRNVFKTLWKDYPEARDGIPRYSSEFGRDEICKFEGILSPQQIDGYRNKVNFSIGKDAQGQVAVGFRVGGFRKSGLIVGEPSLCPNIPDVAKEVAQNVCNFIQGSEFKVYDKFRNEENGEDCITGVFRMLSVRISKANREIMVILQIHPQDLSDTQKSQLKKDFVKYLQENFDSREMALGSILWQEFDGLSNAAPSDLATETLYGPGTLVDKLCGLSFRIQPNSFFQVNNESAEIVYGKVAEWLDISSPENTIIFDVCCGTGTIGLSLASLAHKVIGLELVPAAVQDAVFNAKLNEIENANFIVGKAEDSIERVIKEEKEKNPTMEFIAVVDPPREGLHRYVLRGIRECENIEQLVYVSCNPKTLSMDLLKLIRPSTGKRNGAPFEIVKAVAVDMFPHTDHCEMVVYLRRSKTENGEEK